MRVATTFDVIIVIHRLDKKKKEEEVWNKGKLKGNWRWFSSNCGLVRVGWCCAHNHCQRKLFCTPIYSSIYPSTGLTKPFPSDLAEDTQSSTKIFYLFIYFFLGENNFWNFEASALYLVLGTIVQKSLIIESDMLKSPENSPLFYKLNWRELKGIYSAVWTLPSLLVPFTSTSTRTIGPASQRSFSRWATLHDVGDVLILWGRVRLPSDGRVEQSDMLSQRERGGAQPVSTAFTLFLQNKSDK